MEVMAKALKRYVVSFQTESFHKGRRHHWMICRADNGEELVSWGHEPTRELAEAAAEKEIHVLSTGMTQGGAVISATKPFSRRRAPMGR
jgi:hypothetical protein